MTIEDFNWDAYENSEALSSISAEELEKAYDGIINTVNKDEIVDGTVIAINKREVVVNIGYKLDGIIPALEFRYNPDLKIGDIVEVLVENESSRNRQLILSHRKARSKKAWEKVNQAYENNETISCYVKCRTKGGMIVDIYGFEALLPASQIDIVRVSDFDVYIGKNLDVKIDKINKEFKNVVVSHKIVMTENLQKKSSDKTLLKDIWQKHTEVQEQILRQRTAPLAIVPCKSEIINEKLHVVLDTSDNTEQIKNDIIQALDITDNDCHFDDGYIFTPITNWNKLDESTKSRISTKANKEYVSFTFSPVIDGKITDKKAQFTEVKELLEKLEIDYDFDKNRRLQISINELNKLKDYDEFNRLQVALPEIASAIIPTYPSILYYLERICQNHNFKNIETFKDCKKTNSGVIINKQLVVEGGYFKNDVLVQLEEIFALRMCKVEFDFTIDKDVLHKYDWTKNILGLPKEKNGTITFRRKIKERKAVDIIYDDDLVSEGETIEESINP